MRLKAAREIGKENMVRAQARPQALPAVHLAEPHRMAASLFNLQRTHGNRFVQRMLNGATIQRKCACGNHTVGGRECAECSKDKLTLQHASLSPRGRGTEGEGAVPPIVHEVLRSSGQPLDNATRAFFEPRLGYNFSQVRVHTDAKAGESARAVYALAYTFGHDIVFGTGRYAPWTVEGRKLLAHELTHVIQQATTDAHASVAPPVMVGWSQNRFEAQAEKNAQSMIVTDAISIDPPAVGRTLLRQAAGPVTMSPPPSPRQQSRRGARSAREETRTLTKRQVARDQYLRGLAARPMFALERWRRLRPGEQTIVVQYMAMFYGLPFVHRFFEVTSRHPQPETVITITNWQTPKQLQARGYALARSEVHLQIWVHPSGHETWLVSAARVTEVVGEKSEPMRAQDPVVTEAQQYADDFTAARDRLIDQLANLKRKVGTREYAQLYHQHLQDFNNWLAQLNLIIDERLAELEREVDPQDQEKLRQQVKRLRELLRWKEEEWSQSVQGLPLP